MATADNGQKDAGSSVAGWVTLVDDARGDVQGGSLVPALESTAHLDLLSVRIHEEADSFRIEFRTAQDQGYGSDTTSSVFGFKLQDATLGQEYEVEIRVNRDGQRNIQVWREGVPVNGGPMTYTGFPWRYDAEIGRNLFTMDGTWGPGDRVVETWAFMEDNQTMPNPSRDRGPDSGFGTEYVTQIEASRDNNRDREEPMTGPVWTALEGPDFAGAPSVAVGPGDGVHVAFVVYSGDRDLETGLYHGIRDGGHWKEERVAPFTLADQSFRDHGTATGIDVDDEGRVHIVYHPHPGAAGPGEISYVRGDAGTWSVENPAAARGRTFDVEDGFRAIPTIVSRGDRVVVAFQEADGDRVLIVERTANEPWSLVQELDEARFPRLALDADERLSVAWFRPHAPMESGGQARGDLMYAAETSAWKERIIARDIREQTEFWQTAEVDGTFDFALSPSDEPTFVWEAARDERRFAVLGERGLETSATPLEPVHGNPQLRMRMAIDAAGFTHVISGYGGADLYAMRTPNGTWYKEDFRRVDMFSFDVHPDGRAIIVGTQPHGGTTLDVSVASQRPGGPLTTADGAEPLPIPAGGVLLTAAVVAAVAAFSVWAMPRGVHSARGVGWSSWAAVAGFSRLSRNRLLAHQVRDDIVSAVQEAPGRPAHEVRHDLGLPRTTFFYHVKRLAEAGLLRVHPVGRDRVLMPRGHTPAGGIAPAADSTIGMRVFEAVRAKPGLKATEYARVLAMNERTTRHHLLRLQRAGALTSQRGASRAVSWQVQDDARD